jgi:hypothetical protein
MYASKQLETLRDSLLEQGLEPEDLESLELEASALSTPPGFVAGLKHKVQGVLSRQWGQVRSEASESAEALSLIAERLKDDEPLSNEERDKIRAQVLDVVKAVPAGLFAVVNGALPIPGTSLLTPWLLNRAGLMPSQWREAHLLNRLRQEAVKQREAGNSDAAKSLDELSESIESEAMTREQVQDDAALLSHWDTNENGIWDPAEREAYESALHDMLSDLSKTASRKLWFVQAQGIVFGPLRISRFLEQGTTTDEPMLVCYDGKSGWIQLSDLNTEGLAPSQTSP